MEIEAYFENWSLRPGDRARMAISTRHAKVRAVLERLTTGPGAKGEYRVGSETLSTVLDTTIPCHIQATAVGSYAKLPLSLQGLTKGWTLHCWVWPTVTEQATAQTLWSCRSSSGTVALVLVNGGLEIRSRDRTEPVAVAAIPITKKRWYSVAVAIDADAVAIDVALVGGLATVGRAVGEGTGLSQPAPDLLLLAAADTDDSGSPVNPFNGKIDTPRLYAGSLAASQRQELHRRGQCAAVPVTSWRVNADWGSRTISVLTGDAPSGTLHNGAERGVTGHNWDGTSDTFLAAPDQYGAFQFHDDDVLECNWAYDLEFELPADLKSGAYAVRLEAGDASDLYPFFVAGARNDGAAALFLFSTNTYLAYANDHLAGLDLSVCMPHAKVVPEDEQALPHTPRLGRSLYDVHSDGTPVRYAGRRRPLVNVRPGRHSWITDSYRHFPADLYFIEWLEKLRIDYHVATDEDVEREGIALLGKYSVLITASHPEYWTRSALEAVEEYVSGTGKLMYMGGDGFYWVTTRDPQQSSVIEVRRDNSGTRSWDAPYGERMHTTTGELGGIWRTRGRAPNRMTGIGFAAQGWGRAVGYQRNPVSYEASMSHFFSGIEEMVVGDNGHVLGGAAGDEVDRFDLALGSPAHAVVLASATGLGREYQLVVEDMTLTMPDQDGSARPDMVRADMVYFATEGGGAVFSVGSISYVGAMAWNDFDNAAARVATNVLLTFIGNRQDAPKT